MSSFNARSSNASLHLCVWCGPPRVRGETCVSRVRVWLFPPMVANMFGSVLRAFRTSAWTSAASSSTLRALRPDLTSLPQSSHQHPQYSVRRLLNRGVKGNGVITKSGATPLMVAVHANDVRLLRPCYSLASKLRTSVFFQITLDRTLGCPTSGVCVPITSLANISEF